MLFRSYSKRFFSADLNENIGLIVSAIISAVIGAIIGKMLLKKITLGFIQILVAVMLIIISVALAAGFI